MGFLFHHAKNQIRIDAVPRAALSDKAINARLSSRPAPFLFIRRVGFSQTFQSRSMWSTRARSTKIQSEPRLVPNTGR